MLQYAHSTGEPLSESPFVNCCLFCVPMVLISFHSSYTIDATKLFIALNSIHCSCALVLRNGTLVHDLLSFNSATLSPFLALFIHSSNGLLNFCLQLTNGIDIDTSMHCRPSTHRRPFPFSVWVFLTACAFVLQYFFLLLLLLLHVSHFPLPLPPLFNLEIYYLQKRQQHRKQ